MVVYCFNEESGECLYEHECLIDSTHLKKTGEIKYLIPKCSTLEKPLPSKSDYKVVFNGVKWVYELVKSDNVVENALSELELRKRALREILEDRTEKMAQMQAGAVFTDEEKSQIYLDFQIAHNQLRELEGKSPRQYC